MSFNQQSLSLEFELQPSAQDPNPVFSNGTPRRTVEGLRMHLSLNSAGSIIDSYATVVIWGMSEQDMLRVSTFEYRLFNQSTRITIRVGGTVVHVGTIFEGVIDYNAMPAVSLTLKSNPLYVMRTSTADSVSFPGTQSVDGILREITQRAGLALEPYGLTGLTLTNMAVSGSLFEQLLSVCYASGLVLDSGLGSVVVYPKGGALSLPDIEVNIDNGLVSYPEFYTMGLKITTEYNPAIRRGRVINVTSRIPQACRRVVAYTVEHNLSWELPGGLWFTTAYCQLNNLGAGGS